MKHYLTIQFCLAILITLAFFCNGQAAGVWISGEVDVAPYTEGKYRYIVIGSTRYTITSEAVARQVISQGGKMYKPEIDIADIGSGEKIRILAEGNSIYQIELLR